VWCSLTCSRTWYWYLHEHNVLSDKFKRPTLTLYGQITSAQRDTGPSVICHISFCAHVKTASRIISYRICASKHHKQPAIVTGRYYVNTHYPILCEPTTSLAAFLHILWKPGLAAHSWALWSDSPDSSVAQQPGNRHKPGSLRVAFCNQQHHYCHQAIILLISQWSATHGAWYILTGVAGVARPAGAGATAAIVPPTTPRRAKPVTPVNIKLSVAHRSASADDGTHMS